MYVNLNKKIVPATHRYIGEAADILKGGGLVAFPTETVYGLGANALDPAAVSRLYRAKGRPQNNPLILHVSGIMDASRYAGLNSTAEILMHQFWPGPLTLVLFASDKIPSVTRAGLDTVALRAPLNMVALDLIREAGLPIAGPSANRSGRPSPTTAQTVYEDLGDEVDMIIDGGPTTIGVESTVVDVTGDLVSVLRPGGVTVEMLEEFVDLAADDEEFGYRSPGNLHRHYAPQIPLLLWDPSKNGDGIFVRVEDVPWCYMGLSGTPEGVREPMKKIVFGSVQDYAKGLFSTLRDLETLCNVIVAELPEDAGLGRAVRNRLEKAAAPE